MSRRERRAVTLTLEAPLVDFARLRRERLAKLQAAMRADDVDTLVLIGQNNVAYATGARAPAADASLAAHQRMVAVVHAGAEWPHLFTAFPDGVPPELPDDHRHEALHVETDVGAGALAATVPAGRIAIDEYTYPLYRTLDERGPIDAAPIMSTAKVIKTRDEIELIRAAQLINEAAMRDVEAILAPGVHTTELSGRFLRRVYELGATANTVDPIFQVMPPSIDAGPFSLTGDLVFPTVTREQRLERGDVIWVDTGINFHGYASDFGRTWTVGREPDDRQLAQFREWRAILERVAAEIRPGATAADLVRAAGTVYGRRPWPSHLYLGHGIGTDSAEMPLVGTDLGPAFDASITLAPGMIIVLEPIAWEEGHGGYRAEEIVTVTDDGCEFLTHHHYWPFA